MFLARLANFWRQKFSKQLDTFNLIEISRSAILHNFDLFQSFVPQAEIWPVLKANAYGHGLEPVAEILKARKFTYFVVDSYYEALKIWQVNPHKVLLIGQAPWSNYQFFDFSKLAVVVYRLEVLRILGKLNQPIKIHLKINTGLNRQGIKVSEVPEFLDELKNYPKIELEGVCSHFISSEDSTKDDLTRSQESLFLQAVQVVREHGFQPKYLHLSNSSGIIKTQDNQLYNAVRLGLGLYGVNPIPANDPAFMTLQDLKPALTFWSTLIHKIDLQKGDGVSYGSTFVADRDMTIGLIPVGYYEFFNRRLSNRGFISYQDKFLPLVGNICMNLSMCSLEGANIQVGDRIKIISPNSEDLNSVYQFAKLSETITYEVLVKLAESLRRVVVP